MGAFLEKPKTEKTIGKGTGYNLEWGVSSMQGWRMEMEDAHTCETRFSLPNWGFFAVFDGHAGPRISEFCSQNLLPTIMETIDGTNVTEADIQVNMQKAFTKLDEKVREKFPEDRGGTTALAVMISPNEMIWANCGDSRGFICRNGQELFTTVDHKPYDLKEKKRIEKAGGTVMMQRVNGSLAVSRALGDFSYKRAPYEDFSEQLVSPEPEVTKYPRHEDDDFVFLACDGIYDVMSNQEIIAFVMHQLEIESDLSKICSDLLDTCLNKNSRDNMSAILITFPHAPKPTPEAIARDRKAKEEVREKIAMRISVLTQEAQDPMDLEENYIVSQLSKELENQVDVYSQRPFISERLESLRLDRFKRGSEGGQSDSSQAPPELQGSLQSNMPVSFGTDQSSEVEFSEEQCSEMESNGVPKDDKPSNNKMEQSEASPTKT